MIVTLLGGIAIGAIIVIAPMLVIRKRKKRIPEKETEIVREEPEASRKRETQQPRARGMPELPAEDMCGDLDSAMTSAVRRALSENNPDLDLTVAFPEKCKVFGETVASKGTITIQHRGNDEVFEAIRVVGRKVSEVESSLEQRIARIESSLELTPEKKNAVQPETPSVNEQDAEVKPLF